MDQFTRLAWFDLSAGDDLQIVLGFLDRLPDNLFVLFDQESFGDLDLDRFGINRQLFFSAFYESADIYREDLSGRRHLFTNPDHRPDTLSQLSFIGFTGPSLILKARLLNAFWERIEKMGGTIIDFAKKPVVKQVLSFLKCLNDVLGSLLSAVPGIEIIKEWKESGESYLELAGGLGDGNE